MSNNNFAAKLAKSAKIAKKYKFKKLFLAALALLAFLAMPLALMVTIGSTDPVEPAALCRARLSLDGLSVGDAFGQCFFSLLNHIPFAQLNERPLPAPPWMYTDDTIMACGIVEVLQRHGHIDQDDLAQTFARRFMADPDRGYGGMAKKILVEIYAGGDWRDAAASAFDGGGSMGNGSAMRVAPLGAYFADDISRLIDEAAKSAAVTHTHPEGIAGAIAVALAAGFAANHRGERSPRLRREFLDFVLDQTPPGATRDGIAAAVDLPRSTDVPAAVTLLGNGARVTCPDTVPLCLWLAARHFDDYEDAMWAAVSALGDIDTNAAIVGGIIALSSAAPIPPDWLDARGPLPR
jgi:ADP-ribosylglycohydrolase